MQMVIPCGGLAKRLGDIAKDVPKSMVDVNGRPFLEWQLKLVKENGFDDIVLCIGHLGEQIRNHFGESWDGMRIHYSIDNQLGVIGAVKNAESLLQDVFFMMYGDSFLQFLDFKDMMTCYIAQNKLAMIAVWKNSNFVDKSNLKVVNGDIIAVDVADADYIDYGVTIMHKRILRWVQHGKEFSTADLRSLLMRKNQLSAYVVSKRLYHIGNPKALNELKIFLSKGGGKNICNSCGNFV